MPTPTASTTKVAPPTGGKAKSSPLEKMVRWIRLLEQTARQAPSAQPMRGTICREHFDCIKVFSGPLTEHVRWKETDPATAAQRLLNGALPAAEQE